MSGINFADPTIQKWVDGDNDGSSSEDAFIQSFKVKLSGTDISSNYGVPVESTGLVYVDLSVVLTSSPQLVIPSNSMRVALKISNPSGTATIAWGISSTIALDGSNNGSGGANVLGPHEKEDFESMTVPTNGIYLCGAIGSVVTILSASAPNAAVSGTSGTLQRVYAATTDATGTTSSAMMGYAVEITPELTGNIKATIQGMVAISDDINLATIQAYYGTAETLPSNGAALTGTAVGRPFIDIANTANSGYTPFTMVVYAPTIGVGEEYWFDVGVSVTGSATAALHNVSILLEEI